MAPSLLLLLLFLGGLVGVAHAGSLVLSLSISEAVIVFDPSHSLLEGLSNETFSYNVSCGSVAYALRARIVYVYAPSSLLEKLRNYYASRASCCRAPDWSPGYEAEWVRLRPFYEYLWRLVEGFLREAGIQANDTLVVIGDIDGRFRVYYEEPSPYLRVGRLEGVRGWAGNKPMDLYDLMALARRWPVKGMPFYGQGLMVNESSEPLLPRLQDPPAYIRSLVHDHLRFHMLSVCPERPWYTRRLELKLVVVDYGGGLAERIARSINTSLVEDLVRMMDPWISIDTDLMIVEAKPGTLLHRILDDARLEDGWLVLPYEHTRRILLEDASKRFPRPEGCVKGYVHSSCSFVFYILATPTPSYMRLEGTLFNFTGFSSGWIGATSYPGYSHRVEEAGLERVIAHEAGHYIGLMHPFQLPDGSTRWLMDFIETPMSYYNQVLAFYRSGDKSPYEEAKTALIHLAAILLGNGIKEVPRSIQDRLDRGDPGGALLLAENMYLGPPSRETATLKSTKTITTTTTSTAYVTMTKTLTITIVSKTTMLLERTTTTTTTTTITLRTEAIRPGTGLQYFQLLLALAIGLALGYAIKTTRRG